MNRRIILQIIQVNILALSPELSVLLDKVRVVTVDIDAIFSKIQEDNAFGIPENGAL